MYIVAEKDRNHKKEWEKARKNVKKENCTERGFLLHCLHGSLYGEVRGLKLLEDRICRDGTVLDGEVLKLDSFLNHQLDVGLFAEMGREWARLYAGARVTKILTIEASGIGIACVAAEQFGGIPVVFAKKSRSRNLSGEVYHARVESFTHGQVNDIVVSRKYLCPEGRVLIIDDFLANGAALQGLIALVKEAGAVLVGAGIAVEKAFQPGGEKIRAMGVRVESLAKIKSMGVNGIEFC